MLGILKCHQTFDWPSHTAIALTLK